MSPIRTASSPYDILFCAATYKSPQNAIRYMESASNISGNNLVVLVACLKEDFDTLVATMRKTKYRHDTALLLYDQNNMYKCRAAAFLWALFDNRPARFMCSGDDDVEWLDDNGLLVERLDEMSNMGILSVATFPDARTRYLATQPGDRYVAADWLNGHAMFSQFSHNLMFGLPDTLPDADVTYFTETEYQIRMSVMTGIPTMFCTDLFCYHHHFREDEQMVALRNERVVAKINAGKRFLATKFATEEPDINRNTAWHTQMRSLASKNPTMLARHLMYNGEWNDWETIVHTELQLVKYVYVAGG